MFNTTLESHLRGQIRQADGSSDDPSGDRYLTTSQTDPDPMVGYRVNRVTSLVYLWYALFEIHSVDAHRRILDLCADDFELWLSPTSITTAPAFAAWYAAQFGRFDRSRHTLQAVSVSLVTPAHTTVGIDFTHTIHLDGQTQVFSFQAQMRVVETDARGPLVAFYQPAVRP